MNAQPGMRLCCSHTTKSGLLMIKKVKIKKIMYVYIHDILVLLCQFTSS